MQKSRIAILVLLAVVSAAGLFSAPLSADADRVIGISDNGRYFLDDKGKPFFWQGDTEWELLRLFSVEDAKALLEERRKQGFNVVQVMVTGVFPEWGIEQGMKPWAALPAWLDNNPLTPNEAYFRRADAIVAAAEECGIVLVLGVYHSQDSDAGRINAQTARPWAHWLAQRYKKSRNIIWSMYPHADPASEPVVSATVQGLQAGDGGAHLITMHPDPSPTSSSFMHCEPWLAFNTLQTWSTDLMNYDMVRADHVRVPVKPVVDGEARYEEEDGTTPLQVRRAGYWACLAGGFYSYGHRDNWKSPGTWRNWFRAPGALQMKIMGDLFRSLEWWKLVADQTLFEKPTRGNVAARSADGDWILAYLSGNAPVSLKLDRLATAVSVTCWWIDPLTGSRTKLGTFPAKGTRTFTPPKACEDAILLITKEAR